MLKLLKPLKNIIYLAKLAFTFEFKVQTFPRSQNPADVKAAEKLLNLFYTRSFS